jgi:spermidine synthase
MVITRGKRRYSSCDGNPVWDANPVAIDKKSVAGMNIVQQLLDWMASEETLLGDVSDNDQTVAVHQHANYRWLYTGGQSVQSVMRLDAPEQLPLNNQQMMLVALLLWPEAPLPRHILNLGFGGGGFERFFHARMETVKMLSLDINRQLVALVRQYLQVPGRWPVSIQAAEVYLAAPAQVDAQTQSGRFELILCDLFDGEYHADCLNQPPFYANAAQSLSAAGVMTMNLAPKSDQQLVDIIRFARRSFAGVMLSRVPEQGNVVIILAKQRLPTAAQLQVNAGRLTALWQLDFVELLRGFKWVP